jgi:large subunit ribosomal protein L25
MNQKITTEIPLEFVGESRAKKEEGALIMKNLNAVEVECLPADLVNYIEVDLSSLNEFGDSIHVKDLKVPSGMEILEEDEGVVVSAIEPKEEEEEPIEGEEEASEEGEEGEEKKEETAAADGEEKKAEDKKDKK